MRVFNRNERERIIMRIWRESEELTSARVGFELLKDYPMGCPIGNLNM